LYFNFRGQTSPSIATSGTPSDLTWLEDFLTLRLDMTWGPIFEKSYEEFMSTNSW